MLKVLKCDFWRSVINRGFLLSAAVTAALCFFNQVFSNPSNGKAYSVLEALFAFDYEFMAANVDFSPPVIINRALSGYYLSMALPITASFPFVFSFVSERNSRNIRYTVVRTGRGKYYISKFLSAIISGGLCTALGIILFGIFIYFLFPNAHSPQAIADYIPDGAFITLVRKVLSAFIYGAASVLPAFFLCSFCTNPYIILCVPFLLKFILETVISQIQINAATAGDIEAYERLTPFLPSSLAYLLGMPTDETFFKIIAVNLLFAAAMLAGFSLIMEKRKDMGE